MSIVLRKLIFSFGAGVVAGIIAENFLVGVAFFAVILTVLFIPIYINYAKDNPKHYWFKRKLFGWGWTPVTWQGWIVVLGYIALAFVFGLTLDEDSPPREVVFTFLLPLAVLTSLLIRIAYRKGERPKWQWGKELKKYQ